MSNLSELLKQAVARVDAMSPVELALMEAQQKRSWVIGETGRDPGLGVLAEEVLRLRKELEWQRGDKLEAKEIERVERLKRRAYHVQNNIDWKPRAYNMDRAKAELSALRWAIEKITGSTFNPQGGSSGDAVEP